MAKPVNCPYFFGDYHRGREIEACRLIERNPHSRPWKRPLCDTCPVPGLLRSTTCPHLALEASVVRKWWLFERVEVFAICTKHNQQVDAQGRCAACDAEREEQRQEN